MRRKRWQLKREWRRAEGKGSVNEEGKEGELRERGRERVKVGEKGRRLSVRKWDISVK